MMEFAGKDAGKQPYQSTISPIVVSYLPLKCSKTLDGPANQVLTHCNPPH